MSTRYALGDHAYTARQLAALLEDQPAAAPQVAAALRSPKPRARGIAGPVTRPGALPPWPGRTGLYLVDLVEYRIRDMRAERIRGACGVALYIAAERVFIMATTGQRWQKTSETTLYACQPVYPHTTDGIVADVMDAAQIEVDRAAEMIIHPTLWSPAAHATHAARAEASETAGVATWATRLAGQVHRIFAAKAAAVRRAELSQLAALALAAITHMRLGEQP